MPISEADQNAARISSVYIEPAGRKHSGFQLNPATLPTSFAAGDLDVDAEGLLYLAGSATQRGLVRGYQMIRADAVLSLGNTTNATDMFLTDVTVKATTVYRFNLRYSALTGATATTLSFLFSASGTATFATVAYTSYAIDAAAGTAAAPAMNTGAAATAVVVGASGTGVVKRISIEGEFETTAGGTVIPQIKFSADPTGTCQTQVGSYFELYEVGVAGLTTIGPFA
jgi:hypothetical protein